MSAGRYLARQRLTSSPQKTTLNAKLIFRRKRMRWPVNGPTSSCMLFPDRSASQGAQAQSASGGPALEEPSLGLRGVSAADSSSVAHSPQAEPPLSGEHNDLAPPA